MGILSAAVVKLAETLVRTAVEAGTGNKKAGDLGAGVTAILGGRLSEAAESRRVQRALEEVGKQVAERINERFGHEYRRLDEHDQVAAVEAVTETFQRADLNAQLVAKANLDPRVLERELRRQAPALLAEVTLGEDGEQYYFRLLRESCADVVQIIRKLPDLQVAALGEILQRLTGLHDQVQSESDRAERRLAHAVEQIESSSGRKLEDFERRLHRLPPIHHDHLVTWWRDDPEGVWSVVTTFTSMESPPSEVARAWEADPPARLAALAVPARLATATLLAVYGSRTLAASLFISAADDGAPRRQFWLARAALIYEDIDRRDDAQRPLLDAASKNSLTDPFARCMTALLADDWTRLRHELASWKPADNLERLFHYVLSVREALIGRGTETISRSSLDEAIALSSKILRDTWISTVALARAAHLVWRAQRGEADHRHADIREAQTLALTVRDERRTWRGDSAEAVAVACEAADEVGDYKAVLRFGLTEAGEATDQEAAEQKVRRFVLVARTWLGDPPDDVTFEEVGDASVVAAMKAIIALRRGEDPAAHWRAALEAATEDAYKARALLGLARCGQMDVQAMEELSAKLPDIGKEIRAVADLAAGRTDRGIAVLRVQARSSRDAASILAGAYSEMGDVDGLVETLRQAADDFADPELRLEAALELHRADRVDEAEQELAALIAASPAGWQGLRNAQLLAARIAFDAGRLETAAQLARSALKADPSDERTRWSLIHLLLRRADTAAAWRVFREHDSPLRAVQLDDAHCWIQLHREYGDLHETADGCLRLIRQFPDSEQVAAHALVTLIAFRAAKEPLPENLAEELQRASENFFELWPESSLLRRIRGDDLQALVAQMNEMARESPEQRQMKRELLNKVELGQLPVGVLSAALPRSYAEIVLRRAPTVLQAVHADLSEHRMCLQSASTTARSTVVVDTTTVAVLDTLPHSIRSLALGLFRRVITCDLTLHDARVARDALASRSTGSWGWDEDAQTGRLYETSDEEADRLAEESDRLVLSIEQLIRKPRPLTRIEPRLDEQSYHPWAPLLDLAADQQAPVWADDAALRALARSVGIEAISTAAVLQRLLNEELINAQEHQAAITTLFRARVGDFQFTSHRLIEIAEEEGWQAGSVAMALGRPSSWRNAEATLPFVGKLVQQVAQHRPDALPQWAYWLARGAAYAFCRTPQLASNAVAGVVALAIHHANASGPLLRAVVDRCRAALFDVVLVRQDVVDPLPLAAEAIYRTLLELLPPALAAQYVVAAVAQLEDRDRHAVLRMILELTN
ncbi:NACHT N-terminal Helical domain 1-containing protein [Actinokineospora sp. HUAS TT18]|uniref:NACHT N-terminal Helical domain 1-containing protein n=1 Tax=Actinokineospora sp. HUAS TT18 TaxID=3447451 RepID=UPI003F5209D4